MKKFGAFVASMLMVFASVSLEAQTKKNDRATSARQENRALNLSGWKVAFNFESDYFGSGTDQIASDATKAFTDAYDIEVIKVVQRGGFNPCVIPGQKIICVTYGSPLWVQNQGNSGNGSYFNSAFSVSAGGYGQDQRYLVTVAIDLYDNPAPPERGSDTGYSHGPGASVGPIGVYSANNASGYGPNGETGPTLHPLATITEKGDAHAGQNNVSGFLRRASGNYNHYSSDNPVLARIDASRKATQHLLQGKGWLRGSGKYLTDDTTDSK